MSKSDSQIIDLPIKERKYVYIDPACKRPAFYSDHLPKSGDMIKSTGITLLNGQKASCGTPCLCGSCGRTLIMQARNFQEYLSKDTDV